MIRGASLQAIRTRVDRLATAVAASGCNGQHTIVHFSEVRGDDPVPQWPPTDAPERCVCGAELVYSHVVIELRP